MRNTMRHFAVAISLMLAMTLPSFSQQHPIVEKDYVAYLFTYFTGNHISEEAVCYAVSMDGYTYWALNDGKPVLDSKVISSTGGVRDPHILRSQDGHTFYMVVTDMVSDNGWDSNRAMVLLKSNDLVNWTHSIINMQKRYKGQEKLKRVWAPQTVFDPEAGKYMVYWSMQYAGGADIIYYAYANDDFTDLIGEPKPLFIPENKKSCIDGDIVYKDGVFHLFYKTEGHGNGIKVATTRSLTSGQWEEEPDYKQQTKDAVEGAGTFKLINQDKYILMYDVYMKGKYQFTESDFKGKSKNEVIYNDNNYLMFLPKELKSGYEIYDPWNSTYYQFLSRTFASGYGKVWYDVNASKKLTRSAKRAIKNSAGYTSAIQRELQKKKDSISRYSMESEKSTYRLKKGNTYLLVIFTPDSFRFRKKITNGNNYYKEQYLSDIPWSFDLKITYMDEKAD